MAQDDFLQFQERIKQAESRGRRYDDKGRLLTSPKGAQGEMQVMPGTQRSPGFGVEPAKNRSPDEIARVGSDYLAAMEKKYGDRTLAAIAYNMGPGATDKWIAAGSDFSKLPAETQGYVQKVMGSAPATTQTKTAPAPTDSQQMMEGALRSGMSAKAEDLGSGYKAALALSFLGAEDADKPESDADLQARLDKEEEDTAAAELAAYKPYNALKDLQLTATAHLPKQEPVHLAAGGLPFAPSVGIKGSAREELDAIKSQYDQYNAAADAYNAALNKYKSEQYDPYVAAVQKYNDAATAWNAGPRTTDFGMKAPEAIKEFSMTAPTAPKTSAEQYAAMQDAAKNDVARRQVAIDAVTDPERFGLSINKFFADGGAVMGANNPLDTNPMDGTGAMMFSHGGPVHRADGSPMGGENVDHLTPQEIERIAAAQRPAFVTPGSGRNRQQGPISQALNTGTAYPAMARGVAELPYDIAGAPVDLATLALRPFGYQTQNPVMGSDWIKEKMTALGVRPGPEADPTLAGFRTAAELGANLVNPAAVARRVGPAVEQGAKAVGRATGEVMNERMLRGESLIPGMNVPPPIMFAVKPTGGTFATSGSLNAAPISKLDDMLSEYREALKNKLPKDQHDLVDTFVDKKVRKYFTNQFGTANDPLRLAMRSGELPLYGSDVERFPEYLLAAARDPNSPGHAQAKRHLEKFYDEKTNIELKALNLGSTSDADARRRFNQGIEAFTEQQRQRMAAEGAPNEFINQPYVDKSTFEDLERYPNSNRALKNMVAAGEQGTLPSGQVWSLQNQQPFYDISGPSMEFLNPRTVADTIKSLDPNKLKNMSFEQAILEGSKNMRVYREYDTAVDRASKGLSVPKEVLTMFTKPVMKTEGGEWVRLTDPAATKLEGKLLHHSVGGYADNPNYNLGGPEAFKSGTAQIFSLRNEKTALPEVTIEAEKTKDGLKITQIKGDYNSFPSHKTEDVFKFMDKHPDIVKISSEYYPRSNTGAELDQKIGVDWAKSYDHWKSGLPGEWIPTRQDTTRIDYVYGLPEGKAKGGMMERKNTDNRRYL